MPMRLAQLDNENGHQGGTRECDEVTRRASLGQPRLPSQRAQVTAVTRARSIFVELGFSEVRGGLPPRSKAGAAPHDRGSVRLLRFVSIIP